MTREREHKKEHKKTITLDYRLFERSEKELRKEEEYRQLMRYSKELGMRI